jgi:hypothetical protein
MLQNSVIDINDVLIDKEVHKIYEEVIYRCTKILHHANILGFSLMSSPNPNIHQMVAILEKIILPILDNLSKDGNFSPESGIKIANIKQYTLHIQEMTHALNDRDKSRFDRAVSVLEQESMLI